MFNNTELGLYLGYRSAQSNESFTELEHLIYFVIL
jgi:hypothetical protein